MRKTIRKWFWVWKNKKEEVWLNDMAKQGWEVVSVTYWSMWTIGLLITFSRDV